MSQWNNSYGYNNQFQGANTWNGDPNSQFNMNQSYYPEGQYNTGNQYVSFNEFLSQMQGANVNSSASYNDHSYQDYVQTEVQNMPSSSQSAQYSTFNYNNTNIPNVVETQNQYNSNSVNMAFKSNLTPTATEFVPKSSVKPSPSIEQGVVPEPSTSNSQQNDVKSKTSSTRNWRERPQSSHQNGASKYNNDRSEDKQYNPSKPSKTREPNSKYDNNRMDYSNQNSDSVSHNSEYNNSRNQNGYRNSKHEPSTSYRNNDNGSRNHDRYRNNESNNRNQDYRKTEGNRSQDSNYRNDYRSETNSRNYERDSRDYSSESKTQENRNYDSSSRNDRGQSKFNKQKNKDYGGQTFYNSTSSKSSQDVRSSKDMKNKNYAGSQRVRPENGLADDEQYANSYLQQKEDRLERYSKAEKNSPIRNRNRQTDRDSYQGNTDLTQRERLSEQLDKGTLECLVCCERVKQTDSVWSCGNCYHVLHLRCIRKWATSSLVEGKWRCPACQNTSSVVPSEYRCMCGAVRSPDYQRGGGAHTCGKACRRTRGCPHPCTLLCHPGPCPACQATVNKPCGCGAETRSILCSSKLPQECGRVCDKTLECKVHKCTKNCHEGPCDQCTDTVEQVCYCPAGKPRSIPCTAESSTTTRWSCGAACGRVLACGRHVCRAPCHAPDCAPCHTLPASVTTCACGKTRIDPNTRKSCTDPIPLCGNICAKPLSCGPSGDKHFCKLDCHEGECPICPDKTLLQCRCGHSSREVLCAELPEMLNNVLCQKKCNKKLSCGRHRCRTVCCAASSHRCAVVCGRTLSCQTHRCEEFCHTGHCAPCPRVSFSELSCECGAQVALPPVACGARPPACSASCGRPRACGHEALHACHAGACPPCVVLTAKRCHGDHEERKTIPCSQDEFSCGLPCGKPLPCGKHTCIKICHKGACEAGKCTQPCMEKRPSCGHPCAAPCHSSAATNSNAATCPSTVPCKKPVRATCACSRRHMERPCAENARDLAKIMSTLAATKIQDGGEVDLSDVQRPPSMLKTLECDDECRVEARTRRLALALQIRNPDVSAKLAPRYSDHIRNTAAKEPQFAQQIHDKLSELVQLAKKSKQKTRAHSFPSMNWQKRQFIHELCEHFGCESVAYDAEPNRNVVATADKEKSWLPAMSVLAVLEREAGKRRIPGPVLRSANVAQSAATASSNKSGSGWATLTSTNAWAARSQSKPAEPKIDYFNNPPE